MLENWKIFQFAPLDLKKNINQVNLTSHLSLCDIRRDHVIETVVKCANAYQIENLMETNYCYQILE